MIFETITIVLLIFLVVMLFWHVYSVEAEIYWLRGRISEMEDIIVEKHGGRGRE